MSDGPKITSSRAEIVAALMKRGKTNAGIRQRDEIRSILEEMLGRPIREPRGLMDAVSGAIFLPDFEDLPRHKSYKELIGKIETLIKIQKLSIEMLSLLQSACDSDEDTLSEIDERFNVVPDAKMLFDNLVRLNGVSASSRVALEHLASGASNALRELNEEKRALYPSGRGRRKNIHAHLVAERLARFYLEHRKERPTYGTDYGGIPSTSYQRALEKLFKVLEIDADTQGPAKAACNAITDEDINNANKPNPPLGSLLGLGFT